MSTRVARQDAELLRTVVPEVANAVRPATVAVPRLDGEWRDIAAGILAFAAYESNVAWRR